MPPRHNWDTPEEARAFKHVLRDDPDLHDSYENRVLYGYPLLFAGPLVAGISYDLYDASFYPGFVKLAVVVLGAVWLVAIIMFLKHTSYIDKEIDRRKGQYLYNPYLRER